eukprot:TRINITY_DN65340_c0_g1_i1.p1 TRINITY_DN65340_c0_g1~~TRINITY_DN65340_c0_g1_i1.p1  ORF type:complete len:413 (+),score=122.01 TRINITY_DN65340_c0_g1_i1:95-1333(+)
MSFRRRAAAAAVRLGAPAATGQRRLRGQPTQRRGLSDGPIPGELGEYSVVYHDRTHNHMSAKFVEGMQGLSSLLKEAFGASAVAVVPGSGTFGMEAAARVFGDDAHCLVVRNGFFSFRWSQIFDEGRFAKSHSVLKARAADDDPRQPAFEPPPVEEVCARIRSERPRLVCCPHVETSAGLMVSPEYIKAIASATHEVGGYFLLDCIASGCMWIDMPSLGVDIAISAPQKGLAGPACAGFVMMNDRAREVVLSGKGSSFAMSLKAWLGVMENYEKGVASYHATPPTDALLHTRAGLAGIKALGWDRARDRQAELGSKMRALLREKGYKSVAADSCAAPSVAVFYCQTPGCGCQGACTIAGRFKKGGVQIAAGVPLKVDEPAPFNTFRFGFFGIDKLQDPDAYVSRLAKVLDGL